MGCDLHSHVEVYDRDKKRWDKVYMYAPDPWNFGKLREVEPYVGRSYTMFGVLAGVRSMTEPIVQPRDIPIDASSGVLEDWANDSSWCHTPSWLTLAELRLAAKDKKRYNKEERRSLRPLINGIDFMIDSSWLFKEDSEVRVVFYFDN